MSIQDSVLALANATAYLNDEQLGESWAWKFHDEGVRMSLLGSHHELRELGVKIGAWRNESGNLITAAQLNLAGYHAAFWDLRAILWGVDQESFEQSPSEGEWGLRQTVSHIMEADKAFSILIRYALDRVRQDENRPMKMSEADWDAYLPASEWEAFERFCKEASLERLMADFQQSHEIILSDFAGIAAAELEAPNVWWEGEPLPVRHRLHRFEAHLRQHTIQAEKILLALGKPPAEAQRLVRLLFNGLAQVESGLLGVGEMPAVVASYAQTIRSRAEEIAGKFAAQ